MTDTKLLRSVDRFPFPAHLNSYYPLARHRERILQCYSLGGVLDLSLVVGDELELLIGLSPRLVERHVRPVLEEAHLGRVLPVLGADHDQALQLDVAAEGDVEEQLLVGVGYNELQNMETYINTRSNIHQKWYITGLIHSV